MSSLLSETTNIKKEANDSSNLDMDTNKTASRYDENNTLYSSRTGSPAQPKLEPDEIPPDLKSMFAGSLMSVGKSDIGKGCYDITLTDGSSGTLIKGLPDCILGLPSFHTKDSAGGLLENAFQPPVPLAPSAPSSVSCKTMKEPICTKKERLKIVEKKTETQASGLTSSALGVMRPGARHHLIDIHGMALFLRKSTRCVSCQEANCLYVTGSISAQLGAVTKVKITCEKCNNTLSQALLRPNQVPEQASSQNTTDPHSPHEINPPKESSVSQLHSKILKHSNKEDKDKKSMTSDKSIREKDLPESPSPSSSVKLPTMQLPFGNSVRLGEDTKSLDCNLTMTSDRDLMGSNLIPNLEYLQPDTSSEWLSKNISCIKNEKRASSSSPCLFPDVATPAGLSTLGGVCDETTCCPNKLGTSLCPVTGILRHLSPSLGSFQDNSSNKHSPDKTEFFTKKHQNVLSTDKHESSGKVSYLAKLLQSHVHNNISPASSPCSLSSSPSSMSSASSFGTHSACDKTSISSNALIHSTPSLLRLWSSPDISQNVPFSSQIYSSSNIYDYQHPQIPPNSQTTPPLKRNLQGEIEESLRRVQRLIFSTKTPPHYKTTSGSLNTLGSDVIYKKHDTSINTTDASDNIDLKKLLHDNQMYLEYLQDKFLSATSCDPCSSKDCYTNSSDVPSKKLCRRENEHKHRDQAPIRHRKDGEEKRCKSPYQEEKVEKSQEETLGNKNYSSNISKQDKSATNSNNASLSSPANRKPYEKTKNTKKNSSKSAFPPKYMLKLDKKHFLRRFRLDGRSMQRWIRANSFPFYCCHDRIYHKRLQMKHPKRSRHTNQTKTDKTPVPDNSTVQSTENTSSGCTNALEDLNDFLDTKEEGAKKLKGEISKKMSDGKEKANRKLGKGSKEVHTSSKESDLNYKSDALHEELRAVVGWMKSQNVTDRHQRHKGSCGKGRIEIKPRHRHIESEGTTKRPGKFHDLLSSENESDSEDGKLTIDFNNENQ